MPPTKRIDTCYHCFFWEGRGPRGRGPKGTCHRYPPAVTPRDIDGRQPTTGTGDWCGEFRRDVGAAVAADEEAGSARTIYDDLIG